MKKYRIDNELTKWTNKIACDLASRVIERLNNIENKFDIEYIIWETIYDFAIDEDYSGENEWLILRLYCTPHWCDLVFAKRELYNDIYNLIEEVED